MLRPTSLLALAPLALPALADVPTYRVEPVAQNTPALGLSLRGASDAGLMVGYRVEFGLIRPVAASLDQAPTDLPLPAGYQTGMALDANSAGVVVGSVAQSTFPFDTGEPAIWTPDGSGGWDVTIPQQFATVPGPFGTMGTQGGQAVGVAEDGTVVGWTRFQGFQGGPSTLFSLTGAPVNLAEQGFTATARAISDDGSKVVGGRLRMDLASGTVTDLGLPAAFGQSSFADAIAYDVNDAGESVVAGRLATSLPDKWLTFRHDDAQGYAIHDPTALPMPIVGFYDINDGGDVSATGGVWFDAEGVLVDDYDALLSPNSGQWDPALGFIGDDRRVYTTAVDTTTGASWWVTLVPEPQAQATVFDGAGQNPLTLSSTTPPAIGTTWQLSVDLVTVGAAASVLYVSPVGTGQLPTPFGEILLDPATAVAVAAGGSNYGFGIVDPALAGASFALQAVGLGAGQVNLSNALDVTLGY